MIKNTQNRPHRPQSSNQSREFPVDFYLQSFTQPLKIQQHAQYHQEKMQRREKRHSNQGKPKKIDDIWIKITEEDTVKHAVKFKQKHIKGNSMDLQIINELASSSNTSNMKDQAQKNKKIVVNSNFLQQMRKRNIHTQMKGSNVISKMSKNQEKNEVKKAKQKKSNQHLNLMKKYEKNVSQINLSCWIPFNQKKKVSKNAMKAPIQHSLTFSTKLGKNQTKSQDILQQRRCKSSLKQKKHSKVASDLKNLSQSLQLSSKLNSLYSNTTSLYNSHNDLSALIQKKISIRIPTEEVTEQLQEIRKYESLVLNSENSVRALRNVKNQNLIRNIEHPINDPQSIKTQDIINSVLQKIETQSQLEIAHPPTFDKINEIYNQQSSKELEKKKNSKKSSLIEELEDISIDQNIQSNENQESRKLNEVISIIQKGGNNLVQKNAEKQYVIKIIKEIIQNKKGKQTSKKKLVIEKNEQKQAKTKAYADSNSLNTSSLNSSIASQVDISVLNLQILDKALREREEYLQGQLKRQIQKIEDQQQPNDNSEKDKASQIERVTKWINNQIKQIHHTRNQLWKGFNVAKNLLKDQITQKNKEMMKCLSEKYIRHHNHNETYKQKRQKQEQKQEEHSESNLSQQKMEDFSKLNEAMLEELSPLMASDESRSPLPLSSLRQSDHLQHENFKFLASNDSNQFLQSQGDSAQQYHGEDEHPSIDFNDHDEDNSSQIDERSLKRQQHSNCNSPRSESDSESYGALIIERQDTFLFSSDKKEKDRFTDLTLDDKEDICEFLFLDLCIEMKDELDQQSKIMKSLKRFIDKMKEQSKRQRGFKTNSAAIKEYLTSFITFLKNTPELLLEIHKALDKSMGPTALEILKYMHAYSDQIEDEGNNYILTAKVFDTFEESYMKTLKIQKYYDQEEREIKRRMFIKNAVHIHNKAIYDAFNQTLDKDRPFGVWGQPFSWKKVPRFSHFRDARTKNDILLKRAQQTIDYSKFLCGFILDKQDCPLKNNPNVTQAYIQTIRYDRLSHLIEKELQESEEKMQFFDDEETQILVDISQVIFAKIILELSQDLAFTL